MVGYDFSHWNTEGLFSAACKTAQFVILKATEGMSYVDSTYKERMKRIIYNGKNVGAYHFYTPSKPAYLQALHFCDIIESDYKLVKDYHKNEKIPFMLAVDVELRPVDAKEVQTFLDTVEVELGQRPLIYCNLDFYNNEFVKMHETERYWIAAYSRTPLATTRMHKNIYLHQISAKGLDTNILLEKNKKDWRW